MGRPERQGDAVTARIGSFVALGDSFTEGLGDPRLGHPGPGLGGPGHGAWRGWADRFAERLAVVSPGLRYANLAVRGKRLPQVLADQVPVAQAMTPGLVSICAGGNDLLGPLADPDELGALFDTAITRLRATGAQVLAFTGFDPQVFPVLRLIRGKVAAYNMHIRSVAARQGCLLADLWAVPALADPRAWQPDRIHLTAEGHDRVALLACEILGIPAEADWQAPLPADGRPARGRLSRWLTTRSSDAAWAREHFTPWAARRLRGVSTGDGLLPKRPALTPVGTGPRRSPPALPSGRADLVFTRDDPLVTEHCAVDEVAKVTPGSARPGRVSSGHRGAPGGLPSRVAHRDVTQGAGEIAADE